MSFEEQLGGNFPDAVKHIQAYLRSNDIYYTRSVLGNFLALLRTNDLIVLAGDSGSGKTNLVKSDWPMDSTASGGSISVRLRSTLFTA